MKYLITESQYKLINESDKRIEFFQDFIDNKVDYIRKHCGEHNADNYPGDIGFASCDQIEQIERIKVIDANWTTIMHSNQSKEHKYMTVKIMVYYSSIRKGEFDADDLTYDLERMIRKSTGMPFLLDYESTNTNKNFNW